MSSATACALGLAALGLAGAGSYSPADSPEDTVAWPIETHATPESEAAFTLLSEGELRSIDYAATTKHAANISYHILDQDKLLLQTIQNTEHAAGELITFTEPVPNKEPFFFTVNITDRNGTVITEHRIDPR